MDVHVCERALHDQRSIQRLAALRQQAESVIEQMIELLDHLDGDDNRELNGDEDDDPGDLVEPSLGWCGNGRGAPYHGACDDLEYDIADDLQGPDTDREHTAIERHGLGFIYAGPDDAEDNGDAENDPADFGIADLDGVAEYFPSVTYGAAA